MLRNPRRLVAALLCAAVVATTACQPEVPAPDAQIVLSGGGWGHGVGMSQYGALGRARAGHDAGQILNAYYPGTAVQSRGLGNIRVHIADAQSTELTNPAGQIIATNGGGGQTVIAAAGERVVVRVTNGAVETQVISPYLGAPQSLAGAGQSLWFSAPGDQVVRVSATGRSYRHGRIRMFPTGSQLRMIVTDLSVEQYLYGLGEMPASWPIEALKAQAIAGRSYAAIRLAAPKNSEYDLVSTTADQAYVGTSVTDGSTSGPNWQAAVDSTAGQVLTHNGVVVQAYYSSSNGGFSERPEYVWVSALPYLTAAADPFDSVSSNPNAAWTRTYTAAELGTWAEQAGHGAIGYVSKVEISGNVGVSGRNEKATITLVGANGRATMTGAAFRTMVNGRAGSGRQLLSTRWTVAAQPSGGGGAALPASEPAPTPAAPAAPADTTPPNLAVFHADPMLFGSVGQVCSFVTSDEPTIYALSINIRGTEVKSPTGGVSPGAGALMCITIPARLRPSTPTKVAFTAVGIDAAVNYRFIQKTVTIKR